MLATGAVLAIVIAAAVVLPLPTTVQMRDWANSVGPWFPPAFLGAHIVATVLPFPVPRAHWPLVCCSGRRSA